MCTESVCRLLNTSYAIFFVTKTSLITFIEGCILFELIIVFHIIIRERNKSQSHLFYIAQNYSNDLKEAKSFKRKEKMMVWLFMIGFICLYVFPLMFAVFFSILSMYQVETSVLNEDFYKYTIDAIMVVKITFIAVISVSIVIFLIIDRK
jgi:hypothetical protein